MHEALWTLVDKHEPLREMVKIGNRVTFLGRARDPQKDRVQVADLPELRLMPTTIVPWQFRTSTTSTLMIRWQWLLSTSSLELDAESGIFDIVWELWRACHNWKQVLQALYWEGQQFVHLMKSPEATIAMPTAELIERNVSGWVALWSAEVTMAFNSNTLL